MPPSPADGQISTSPSGWKAAMNARPFDSPKIQELARRSRAISHLESQLEAVIYGAAHASSAISREWAAKGAKALAPWLQVERARAWELARRQIGGEGAADLLNVELVDAAPTELDELCTLPERYRVYATMVVPHRELSAMELHSTIDEGKYALAPSEVVRLSDRILVSLIADKTLHAGHASGAPFGLRSVEADPQQSTAWTEWAHYTFALIAVLDHFVSSMRMVWDHVHLQTCSSHESAPHFQDHGPNPYVDFRMPWAERAVLQNLEDQTPRDDGFKYSDRDLLSGIDFFGARYLSQLDLGPVYDDRGAQIVTGLTPDELRDLRDDGTIIAAKMPTGNWIYPAAQFTPAKVDPRLETTLDVLIGADCNNHEALAWWTTHTARLGGLSPLKWITTGAAPAAALSEAMKFLRRSRN